MIYTVKHYENEEGIIADICYDKYNKYPQLHIGKMIDDCRATMIFKSFYATEENAVKAMKAYIKRHGYNPLKKTYDKRKESNQ